jgi:hypothetical protein
LDETARAVETPVADDARWAGVFERLHDEDDFTGGYAGLDCDPLQARQRLFAAQVPNLARC